MMTNQELDQAVLRLGQMLRRLRRNAGLSLADMSDRVGISVRTLSRYELGRQAPNIRTVLEIADAAGYTLDYKLASKMK